jgi:nucleotide-binding universal stress UspA family protein
VAQGILAELNGNVKLVLMGWPGPLNPDDLVENVVKVVLLKARANVAVLLDRGLKNVRRILVPVGGGPHSRLAVRLAYEVGEPADVQITVLHCFDEASPVEELEDQLLQLREIVEDELGAVPRRMGLRLARAHGVTQGILAEVAAEAAAQADRDPFDLIVIGASEEWISRAHLFGTVDDVIATEARCSVLLVRRYEPAAIAWVRRRVSGSA